MIIIQALKKILDETKRMWVEKLLKTLWLYKTIHKNRRGETTFQLAFGTRAIILIEIGLSNFKFNHYEQNENDYN